MTARSRPLILNHMVVRSSATLDATFHALAHPVRRGMLALLVDGERSVGELAAPFDVSLAASSKHLKVLERAGLVRRRVVGRTHACSLNPEPLAEASDWTDACRAAWAANFARLDDVLDELKTPDRKG